MKLIIDLGPTPGAPEEKENMRNYLRHTAALLRIAQCRRELPPYFVFFDQLIRGLEDSTEVVE